MKRHLEQGYSTEYKSFLAESVMRHLEANSFMSVTPEPDVEDDNDIFPASSGNRDTRG